MTDSISQKSGPTEVPHPPQHPQFSDESVRLSTFTTWEVQSPKTLCRAGFFYTGDTNTIQERIQMFLKQLSTGNLKTGLYNFPGEKDAVRCFYCDGSLCNWERAHDPFTEHARWYPNCGFIKSITGSHVFPILY